MQDTSLPSGEAKLVSLARERGTVSQNTGLGSASTPLSIGSYLWADSITSFAGSLAFFHLVSCCPFLLFLS